MSTRKLAILQEEFPQKRENSKKFTSTLNYACKKLNGRLWKSGTFELNIP
jgi:hypothetical protein